MPSQAKYVKLFGGPDIWNHQNEPRLLWIAQNVQDNIWSIAYFNEPTYGWRKYLVVSQWASLDAMVSESFIHKWDYATEEEVFAEIL